MTSLLARAGVDDAGPEDDRLFRDALEGIELLLAVAAEGRGAAQDGEFRQDEIDDLLRLHHQRGLAEEVRERVGKLIIADLQDALIDREDRDARRPVGLVADVQRLAGEMLFVGARA